MVAIKKKPLYQEKKKQGSNLFLHVNKQPSSENLRNTHSSPLSLVKLSSTPITARMQSSTALPTWLVTFC